MAIDFIKVDRTKQLAADLVNAANTFAAFQALITRIKNNVNHMNDGSSYTTVETNTGATAGSGTILVSLVNTMDAIVNGTTGAGGATQQGQISDFVGKLSGQ